MENYLKQLEEKYRSWSNDELILAVNHNQPLPNLEQAQNRNGSGVGGSPEKTS